MSRKVILYIATSVDGYIADEQGRVDWLGGEDLAYEGDCGYSEFIKRIDTVVIGKTTYKQIVTELAPDNWPYAGLKSYVLTSKPEADTADIIFINKDIKHFIEEEKKKEGRDIWVCGGASIANQLMKHNLIDEYHLTIMPKLLGKGIALFNAQENILDLRLKECKTENGIVQCIYIRKE